MLSRWRAAGLLAVILATPAHAGTAGYAVVSETPLPPELDRFGDIRAASDSSVFVAAGKKGTWEIFLDGKKPPRKVVPGDGEPGGFFVHSLLAPSPHFLVIASEFAALTWLDRDNGRLAPPFPFETTVDIDVGLDGRHLALLGARRDPKGEYSPDGAMAWIGSLDKGLADLKPILFAKTGPGNQAMNLCGYLDIGKLRYLADGNLLVIPGVEGGGYLYSSEGRLMHTWEAADLGLEDGCGLSEKEGFRLAAEWRLRYSNWLNQHRVLDDLVPLADGAALLIRTRDSDVTRWRLRVLQEDGSAAALELPITSPSPYAHLRADRIGNRLVVLLREVFGLGAKPSIEQKIMVLEARP